MSLINTEQLEKALADLQQHLSILNDVVVRQNTGILDLEKKTSDTFYRFDEKLAAIEARLDKGKVTLSEIESKIDECGQYSGILQLRIEALEKAVLPVPVPTPNPVQIFPYDLTNAKITYAFPGENGKAFEEPALDAVKSPKQGLTVHPDGSLTFNNEGTATTTNTDGKRCEMRFYKDIKTKSNFKHDEYIEMAYGVRFNKLSANNGVYFGQIHGMSNSATFKLDAGKGKFRAHISRDEAGKDTVTHDFGVVPEIGKDYVISFSKRGKRITASLYDFHTGALLGKIDEENIYRTDDQYPKAGVYSRDPAELTHFKV